MADGGGEVKPPKKYENKEERVKLLREKEAEERKRRLEELKKHALEAQQLREQKEIERRKRMEDIRQKENERRSQVEERKKQIWEAERDRREAILRKNQEREARLDVKRKNERSNIVFAFGSSTPRLLEPSENGASFWAPRRATSTANLRLFPASTTTVTRRPSEREVETKKRASSAGDQMSTSMYEVFHWDSEPRKTRLSLAPQTDPSLSFIDQPCRSVPQTPVHPKPFQTTFPGAGEVEEGTTINEISRAARRKTDLMPTIPSPRDKISSRPSSGTRSLARTPGEMTPSRPGSALSQSSFNCASSLRLRSTPRKPRPFSIHVTGVSKDKNGAPSEEKSKAKEQTKVTKPPTPKHPVTKKLINQQKNEDIKKSKTTKTVENKEKDIKKIENVCTDKENVEIEKSSNELNSNEEVKSEIETNKKEKESEKEMMTSEQTQIENKENIPDNTINVASNQLIDVNGTEDVTKAVEVSVKPEITPTVDLLLDFDSGSVTDNKILEPESKPVVTNEFVDSSQPIKQLEDMTISQSIEKDTSQVGNESTEVDGAAGGNVMSRSKITTEEEAKAALAERRRLAREQAEREAEAERRRLELEAQLEAERIRKEEEEQKRAEEEQLRLLEEARKMEEERLMQAIQEAQKKEAEERERRQQEEAARLEKEEAERKAKEEAERQRIEMAERLKREEEERQARRKRVEAIMKRTRNNPPNVTNKSEKGEEDGAEHEKDESKGHLEAFLHGERLSAERSLLNGQQNSDNRRQPLDNMIGNNSTNGVHALTNNTLANEDCLNSNSTMVTPLIAFQGKTKETPVTANYLA